MARWDWVHQPLNDLLYQPRMTDEYGAIGGMRIGRGKPKYSEKTCPSATLSTINDTWSDLESNPGRGGGKSATKRLVYDRPLLHPLNSSVRSVSACLLVEAFQVRPAQQSDRSSGFLGCHSSRGCTYYRHFLFLFLEWKLISADLLIGSNLKMFRFTVNYVVLRNVTPVTVFIRV
jgi:hypothetical protein